MHKRCATIHSAKVQSCSMISLGITQNWVLPPFQFGRICYAGQAQKCIQTNLKSFQQVSMEFKNFSNSC